MKSSRRATARGTTTTIPRGGTLHRRSLRCLALAGAGMLISCSPGEAPSPGAATQATLPTSQAAPEFPAAATGAAGHCRHSKRRKRPGGEEAGQVPLRGQLPGVSQPRSEARRWDWPGGRRGFSGTARGANSTRRISRRLRTEARNEIDDRTAPPRTGDRCNRGLSGTVIRFCRYENKEIIGAYESSTDPHSAPCLTVSRVHRFLSAILRHGRVP